MSDEIRVSTAETVNWVKSFHGRINSAYYAQSDGKQNSSFRIDLWRDKPGRSSIAFMRMGVWDTETKLRPDLRLGTNLNWATFSAGYIKHGLGCAFAVNDFGSRGPDAELRLYKLGDLLMDVDLGWKIGGGVRFFGFAEDVLHDSRLFGGGISYDRRF